jgi:hypothetical protein
MYLEAQLYPVSFVLLRNTGGGANPSPTTMYVHTIEHVLVIGQSCHREIIVS